MTDDKKNLFLLKGTTEITVLRKVDAYNEFLERMGFKPSQDQDFEKLTVKHQTLNSKNPNYINIHDSLHSNAV